MSIVTAFVLSCALLYQYYAIENEFFLFLSKVDELWFRRGDTFTIVMGIEIEFMLLLIDILRLLVE